MFITKEFPFSAAHKLTKYHGKCERLHGHNYRLAVTLVGEPQENGIVIDFLILKNIVQRSVIDKLDHQNLNDFFENPTTEIVARWIWHQLQDLNSLLMRELDDPHFPDEIKSLFQDQVDAVKQINSNIKLFEVRLWETESASVSVRAE